LGLNAFGHHPLQSPKLAHTHFPWGFWRESAGSLPHIPSSPQFLNTGRAQIHACLVSSYKTWETRQGLSLLCPSCLCVRMDYSAHFATKIDGHCYPSPPGVEVTQLVYTDEREYEYAQSPLIIFPVSINLPNKSSSSFSLTRRPTFPVVVINRSVNLCRNHLNGSRGYETLIFQHFMQLN